MSIDQFYVVFRVGHTQNPYQFYRHTKKSEAIQEAKRLAAGNPDKTFVVMESICAFVNPSAVPVPILGPGDDDYLNDDSIPF